jgi:hypothetical protein
MPDSLRHGFFDLWRTLQRAAPALTPALVYALAGVETSLGTAR